jgi:hypothetical protein
MWSLMLLLASAPPEVASPPVSVLFLQMEARGGVKTDTAALLMTHIAQEAQRLPGYRVTTQREVEATLSQEQLRQLMGCSSVSCAAEIAGALSTDQIVVGDVGRMGDSYLVSMSRVRAKDASVAGRVAERIPADREDALLDAVPGMVRQLFDLAPASEVPAGETPSRADQQAPASGVRVVPWVLRGVGAVAAGAGTLLLLGGLLGAGTLGGLFVADLRERSTLDNRNHVLPRPVAMAANVGLWALVPLLGTSVLLGLVAAGLVAGSWVL